MSQAVGEQGSRRRGFYARALGLATAAAALGAGILPKGAAADTAAEPGLIKIISILARKEGESREDFIKA